MRLRAAIVIGATATIAVLPFGVGFLRGDETLSCSLVAYSVSFLACWALGVRSSQDVREAREEGRPVI